MTHCYPVCLDAVDGRHHRQNLSGLWPLLSPGLAAQPPRRPVAPAHPGAHAHHPSPLSARQGSASAGTGVDRKRLHCWALAPDARTRGNGAGREPKVPTPAVTPVTLPLLLVRVSFLGREGCGPESLEWVCGSHARPRSSPGSLPGRLRLCRVSGGSHCSAGVSGRGQLRCLCQGGTRPPAVKFRCSGLGPRLLPPSPRISTPGARPFLLLGSLSLNSSLLSQVCKCF